MEKIIVYWTNTGNTEEIAYKIASDLGCDAFNINDIKPNKVLKADTIIFGCPAMGVEELEEDEFRPFYEEVIKDAENKKIALFGSYGWGDGEWMRLWEDEIKQKGLTLLAPGLIVCGGKNDIDENKYIEFIDAIK